MWVKCQEDEENAEFTSQGSYYEFLIYIIYLNMKYKNHERVQNGFFQSDIYLQKSERDKILKEISLNTGELVGIEKQDVQWCQSPEDTLG